MADYLPLATSAVAFVFFVLLARQYLGRRRVHQLLWTVAMLFYSVSALMEFLANPDVVGANPGLFAVYYVLAAPLVGLLGAGVAYLLVRRGVARLFLGFVVVFALALAVAGSLTPLDRSTLAKSFSGPLANGFMAASDAYPMTVRVWAIVLNAVGGLVLIGGALYSFVRDRSRTYNIFLAIGGILPSAGGSALGLLGSPDLFFGFELGGTVFLFAGFLMSARYITRREARAVSTGLTAPQARAARTAARVSRANALEAGSRLSLGRGRSSPRTPAKASFGERRTRWLRDGSATAFPAGG